MTPLVALFLFGSLLAAVPWLYALVDSYKTFRRAIPKDRVERLLLLSSCIFDWFGLVLGALFLLLGASAITHSQTLAVLFVTAPYVLAVYGMLKLVFRRQIHAALREPVPAENDG